MAMQLEAFADVHFFVNPTVSYMTHVEAQFIVEAVIADEAFLIKT